MGVGPLQPGYQEIETASFSQKSSLSASFYCNKVHFLEPYVNPRIYSRYLSTAGRLDRGRWEACSDSAFYPHKSPSMPPLPPCLTIQFYSSNQLLFPVIIPISSSSIHLLASFTINLPLLFLFDEFGNFSSFLFAYINMYFISISQSVS